MRKRSILVLVLTFLAGGIVGAALVVSYVAWNFSAGFFGHPEVGAARVVQTVYSLTELREGKADEAVKLLELQLDVDILPLVQATDSDHAEGTDVVTYAIEVARDYRLDHPRTTDDPEYDRAVSHALDEASAQ